VIAELLTRARRRAQAADAMRRSAETTTVSFESGRLKAAGVSHQAGVGLRLVVDGRVGLAGTTALAAFDDLVERARQSAALGEAVKLAFPAATTFPSVATFDPRARDASLDALTAIGRELTGRLARDGCQVNVTVERVLEVTEVGNTAGGAGCYDATGVVVSAEVNKVGQDDVLMVYDSHAAAGMPLAADLDRVVRSINERLDFASRLTDGPSGALPVLFSPSGSACLVQPLVQALSGKSVVEGVSPLAKRVGEQAFDTSLTVVDDATRDDGPSARPFDDEGVASQPLPLIERGVVRGFVYDLETAARAGATSTGHGRRTVFGKPHAAFTNWVMGDEGRAERREPGTGGSDRDRWPYAGALLGQIRDGLIVDELIGVGQGNVMGGAFSHPVALAFRVRNGEIVGRVKQAAVAGNVFQLLKGPIGWGKTSRWIGARRQPPILLEGVSVAAK
jgi:PmbA protein